MENNNLIQLLSSCQWWYVWRAYWRLWPMLLRIKFKQLFKDTAWLTEKITFAQKQAPNSRRLSSPGLDPKANEHLALATQLHEFVRLAARLHFLPATCLSRSILLYDLLAEHGIKSEIIIGVSKNDGQFASHAWVEVESVMVAEPESLGMDFTPLS